MNLLCVDCVNVQFKQLYAGRNHHFENLTTIFCQMLEEKEKLTEEHIFRVTTSIKVLILSSGLDQNNGPLLGKV